MSASHPALSRMRTKSKLVARLNREVSQAPTRRPTSAEDRTAQILRTVAATQSHDPPSSAEFARELDGRDNVHSGGTTAENASATCEGPTHLECSVLIYCANFVEVVLIEKRGEEANTDTFHAVRSSLPCCHERRLRGLECDQARLDAASRETVCCSHQRGTRSDCGHEDIYFVAEIRRDFVTHRLIPGPNIGRPELVCIETARLFGQCICPSFHALYQFGTDIPIITFLASNASIARRLLAENASESTAVNFNPKTADTKARAVPVLPPVYSMTRFPGERSPRCIARPRTETAILSLQNLLDYLPPTSTKSLHRLRLRAFPV